MDMRKKKMEWKLKRTSPSLRGLLANRLRHQLEGHLEGLLLRRRPREVGGPARSEGKSVMKMRPANTRLPHRVRARDQDGLRCPILIT